MSGVGWFGADWAGWVPGAAQLGCAFFCSDTFSIFCFSLFFITFAFVIQKTSNQFVNFSKIPSNSPEL
jgi:hypothetical protein